jgi:hypothetical protein
MKTASGLVLKIEHIFMDRQASSVDNRTGSIVEKYRHVTRPSPIVVSILDVLC